MATYFLSASPTINNFGQNITSLDTFVDDTKSWSKTSVQQVGNNLLISDGTHTATFTNFTIQQVNTLFGQFTNTFDGSQLIVDTAAGNNIGGTAGNDQIIALAGDDTIDAGAGDNLIYGNQGNDIINGTNSGNDTVVGGQGDDTVNYGAASGSNLIYGNLGNDVITAGTGNDTIFGGQGSDVVNGSAASTLIYGNLGNDSITGVAGSSDTVYGGQGVDTIDYSALVAGDTSVIYGNFGQDILTGGAGEDTIFGGQGNDSITGGLGADKLTGGIGTDTFGFAVGATAATTDSGLTTASSDTITDFVTGTDKVQVSLAGAGGTNEAGNAANYQEIDLSSGANVVTNATGAAAAYNNGAIIPNTDHYTFIAGKTDGYLVIDGQNANGNGTADSVITLTGLNSTADFGFQDITSANGV